MMTALGIAALLVVGALVALVVLIDRNGLL